MQILNEQIVRILTQMHLDGAKNREFDIREIEHIAQFIIDIVRTDVPGQKLEDAVAQELNRVDKRLKVLEDVHKCESGYTSDEIHDELWRHLNALEKQVADLTESLKQNLYPHSGWLTFNSTAADKIYPITRTAPDGKITYNF